MWYFIFIIALLQLIASRHDPTICRDLVEKSTQWDGEVAEAIRLQAAFKLRDSIRAASFGLMEAPRGGTCELRFGDIQMVLLGFVILWVIRVLKNNYKCVAFWSLFYPKQQKTRSEPEETEETEETEAEEGPPRGPPQGPPRGPLRVKTPISDSKLRFRHSREGDRIQQRSNTQSTPPLERIISTPHSDVV